MTQPYQMIVINLTCAIILAFSLLIYKYIYPKRPINLLLLLILISILPILSLFRSGTYEAGDLTLHSVFLQSFYKNLRNGNLVPQWAGGLCGGYGCPVFLFEYVLPYYIGSFFHFLGFSYIASIKYLFIFSYITSGITMYLFAKSVFGKVGGFVASIFYLFAPYHLIDIHFRGSVGEVLSFVFIPLVFLFAKKIIETRKLHFFLLQAFSVGFLILTHTSTALIIFPLAFLYAMLVWTHKKTKKITDLLLLGEAFLSGILLTTYYWLPALQELKYTWYAIGLKDVGLDFKPFLEHIYSPARLGFLFQGNNGEQRLIIGYAHLFVVLYALFLLVKKKYNYNGQYKWQVIFFLCVFFLCVFMLLSISKPIWFTIPFLKSYVIAYRMLVPIAFATSLIAGMVIKISSNKTFIFLLCFFTILSTILNWGNRKMIPEDPNAYNIQWSLYTEYAEAPDPFYSRIYDKKQKQIPNLVLQRPTSPLEAINGDKKYRQISRTNTKHIYLLYAKNDVYLKENTFYFPGWEVKANGKNIPINYKYPEKLGIMTFKLPKGLYEIDVILTDSPVRKIAKWISYMSFMGLLFLLIKVALLKNKKTSLLWKVIKK